jgi:rubrerythrin
MERPSELTAKCPQPRTLATGEYECPSCGTIWDRDEDTPECCSPTRVEDARRQPYSP